MVTSTRAAALACTLLWCSAFSAAARAPTAEDLLALRELGDYRGGLTVSPDGAYVAVFERELRLEENDYRYRLLVMPSAGGAPRIVVDAGDIILRNTPYGFTGAAADRVPSWSPNGEWLAYLAMHEGHIELWRVRIDGDAPEPLIVAPGDVLRFAWFDDDTIVVEMAASRETLTATRALDDAFGFHPGDYFTPYAGMRLRQVTSAPPTQFVADLRSGERRSPSSGETDRLNGPSRIPASSGAIAYEQTPDAIAWIAPRTPGDPASSPRLGLYRANAEGADVRQCGRDECTGRMLGAWSFGPEIMFRRMQGHGDGLTALYAWDWSRDTVRRVRLADEELFGCGRASARLICLQESPSQPRRIVSIDPSNGALEVLYDPNPQWTRLDLTRVDLIEVEDAYGNDSFAHLVFPRGYVRGRRYPLVIVQYRSRGFMRGGTGGEYPIHPLAGRGYFVLSVDRPEWRATEAEVSYVELQSRTELDNSENLMKQSALEAMLAELDAHGLIDPRRIGITGLSDGAETVYWAISRSDLFAAAVTSTPPTDVTAWTLGAGAFRRSLSAEGTQGPWDVANPWAAWWARNVTVLHADAIHTPLLMNLPESEAITGFPLATRLAELNRPVDVYLYPGAFHVKWRPAQLLAAQHRAMDWLDFWLRGVEHDDLNEPGRLARWRTLRDARSSR